jgi:hypothetical protein
MTRLLGKRPYHLLDRWDHLPDSDLKPIEGIKARDGDMAIYVDDTCGARARMRSRYSVSGADLQRYGERYGQGRPQPTRSYARTRLGLFAPNPFPSELARVARVT